MALYDLVLAALDDGELASRSRVIDSLRSAGAISPATARPVADLHVTTDDTWRRLVSEGRIREGPPGHFYLFERGRPSTRQRVVKMVVFCLIILLIPIVLVLATRNGR